MADKKDNKEIVIKAAEKAQSTARTAGLVATAVGAIAGLVLGATKNKKK